MPPTMPPRGGVAEPLAVCLHAVQPRRRAPRPEVLITGGGPIGMLTLLAARSAGAAEIVITDVADAPLSLARKIGADAAVNVANDGEREALPRRQGLLRRDVRGLGQPGGVAPGIECVRPAASWC